MKKRSNYRNYELAAGWMYLLCMFGSIVGGMLLNKVIDQENMILAIESNTNIIILSTILELINAFGVLIIAISFYHILKEKYPAIMTGYLILRTIEVALCVILSYLPVFAIQYVSNSTLPIAEQYEWISFLFLFRTIFWSYMYPILFVFSGIFFYSIAYTTKFLPKYISLWGLCSLVGVFMALFVTNIKMIPGIFIITNEIYLGFYLILKKEKKCTSVYCI